MHQFVCSNHCNKKGWLCCKSSCHGCPTLHRRAGPVSPVTTTLWPKAICFSLISPLIICSLSNLALYRLLALLQGSFTETGGKQCACCIRDEDGPVIYTRFIEVILNF